MLEIYTPYQFFGKDNIEVKLIKEQQELSVIIENQTKLPTKGISVMKFYSMLDVLEKEARELRKAHKK